MRKIWIVALAAMLAGCGGENTAANSSGNSAGNSAEISTNSGGNSGDGSKEISGNSGANSANSGEISSQKAANSDTKEQVSSAKFTTGEQITLKSVIGNEITIERTAQGFKVAGSDKILMFDIFGTYCEPCKKEAPGLMNFIIERESDFAMVGLVHFEDVTDEQILNNFIKPYSAYYFIANSPQNERLVDQILSDISYQHALSIPFKVVYKDGSPQTLTNNEYPNMQSRNFYIGALNIDILRADFERIKSGN